MGYRNDFWIICLGWQLKLPFTIFIHTMLYCQTCTWLPSPVGAPEEPKHQVRVLWSACQYLTNRYRVGLLFKPSASTMTFVVVSLISLCNFSELFLAFMLSSLCRFVAMVTTIYLLDCSVAFLTSVFLCLACHCHVVHLNSAELIYSGSRHSFAASKDSTRAFFVMRSTLGLLVRETKAWVSPVLCQRGFVFN